MTSWERVARRIRVPLGFAFVAVYLVLARPLVPTLLVGCCFIILGLTIRGVASGHLQKNEELATSGPYAHTRNPLYLGSLAIAIGFALAARNLYIAVLLVILFFTIYLPVIRSEEEFLAAKFPNYTDYAKQVPRFLPRLMAGPRQEWNFSWDLYWKHREYNATLGSVAIVAALLFKMWSYSR
jgi:protein-S-isoprenylcysteine O-methyltransferase Ste14